MRHLRELVGDSGPSGGDWFANSGPATSSSSNVANNNNGFGSFDNQWNGGSGEMLDGGTQNPVNFFFHGAAPVNIEIFSGSFFWGGQAPQPPLYQQQNNSFQLQQPPDQGGQVEQPLFQANPTAETLSSWNDDFTSLLFSPPLVSAVPTEQTLTNGIASSVQQEMPSLHRSPFQTPNPSPGIPSPPGSTLSWTSSTESTTSRGSRRRGRARGTSKIPRVV